ncbi:hypothetical protein BH24BAC1_BH24BAC1_38280 [soil metagenome]
MHHNRRKDNPNGRRAFWENRFQKKDLTQHVPPPFSFQNPLPSDARLSEEESLLEKERLFRAIRTGEPTAKKWSGVSWSGIAASVALLVGIGVLLLYAVFNASPSAQTRISTAYGETTEVWLPDSTFVVLNANSELSYRTNWAGEETREVSLKGEAFFTVPKREVAGNPLKFIVRTGNWKVEVLGTEFNVLSRDARQQVVLKSGMVRLSAGEGTTILMRPGELVEQVEGSEVVRHEVDPQEYTTWKAKEIVFRDTPLSHISAKIEELYGVNITIKNKALAGVRLTGTFPTNDLGTLLKMVAGSANMEVRQHRDQIEFY